MHISIHGPRPFFQYGVAVATLVFFAALGAGCSNKDEKISPQVKGLAVAAVAASQASWSIRHAPLFAYDPSFHPNVSRIRLGAPMPEWAIVSATSFASADACEKSRLDQLLREGNRRGASWQLWQAALDRKAAQSDINVLARRFAEDTGHDDQMDHARCIHSTDFRLSNGAKAPLGAMYLLAPPTEPEPGEDIRRVGIDLIHLKIRFGAPKHRWIQLGAYDSSASCEEERADRLSKVANEQSRLPKENFSKSAALTAAAVCIGVGDPELKDGP